MAETDMTIGKTKIEYLPSRIADEKQWKEVTEFIKGRFDAARRFDRDFKIDCLNDWYYLQNLLPDGWQQRFFTNSFMPETQIASRSVLEGVMGSLFPRENFFDIWGNDGQNEVSVEKAREKMKHELLKSLYKNQVYIWGSEAIDYGNSALCTCAEPFWDERRTVKPIEAEGFPGVILDHQEVREKFINTRFRMRPISRFDLFPYPGYYNDVQEMPFFIVREFVPYPVFKQRAQWKQWKNADKVDGWLFSQRYSRDNDDYETENLYTRLEATGYGVTGADFGIETIRWVELWHYYEAPPGGFGCRAYAVIADGKQMMCCRAREYDHGMKPIADLIWKRPLDSQLWQAQGVARDIRPYQDQTNTRHAQFSDQLEFQINPMRIAGPNFGVRPLTKIMPRPGQIIQSSGDINALRDLTMPAPSAGLLELAQYAGQGIQRMTNDPRQFVGPGASSDAANTTVGGKQIYLNARSNVEACVRLFMESRGIEPQLQQFFGLVQQFMNPEGETLNLRSTNEVLKRAGQMQDGRLQILPHEISGSYTFRAVGSTKAMEDGEAFERFTTMWEKGFSLPEINRKYSKTRVFAAGYEMAMHRSPAEFEKTDIEIQAESQNIQPLPPNMQPKFKDLKPYPQAAMAALQRAGLPANDGGLTPAQELEAKAKAQASVADSKQIAKTIGSTIEAHAKPRKVPPHLAKAFRG